MTTEKTGAHLLIASGGTGGHFYPAMAVAMAFRDRGGRVTVAAAGTHAQEHVRLSLARGLQAVEVPVYRLPRTPLDALRFPIRFWRARQAAARVVAEAAPDVVLGMGSFASVPVSQAAAAAGVPLVLHEGNAVIGRANRFLARRARALTVSLPLAPGQRSACPVAHTGLPLRQALLEAAGAAMQPRAVARQQTGMAPELPLLLVFGGSQGAKHLNETVAAALESLRDVTPEFQLVHLTGAKDNSLLQRACSAAGLAATVIERDEHIEKLYLAADLVICRAGASTLSELALFGRAAILIPLPTATDDHQTANARIFAEQDAALLLPQRQATPARVAALLRDWLRDPAPWETRGENARVLARPDAVQAITDLLVQAAQERAPVR